MRSREEILSGFGGRPGLHSVHPSIEYRIDDILELLLDIRDANINIPVWGIYCPQHYGSWLRNPAGQLYVYQTKEIAEAHIETAIGDIAGRWKHHLWQVVEFGKQQYVDVNEAPAGTEICPVDYEQRYRSAVDKTTID